MMGFSEYFIATNTRKALIIMIYSRNSKIWLKGERQRCYHWVYQNNNLQRMHILFSLVYIYFSVRWRWWCSIFSVGFASLITRKKIYLFLQLCSRSTFLKSCSFKVFRSIHYPNISKKEISFWKLIPSFELKFYFRIMMLVNNSKDKRCYNGNININLNRGFPKSIFWWNGKTDWILILRMRHSKLCLYYMRNPSLRFGNKSSKPSVNWIYFDPQFMLPHQPQQIIYICVCVFACLHNTCI